MSQPATAARARMPSLSLGARQVLIVMALAALFAILVVERAWMVLLGIFVGALSFVLLAAAVRALSRENHTRALGAFGRSRARRVDYDRSTMVTFRDVAGIDDEKAELTEIVDYLKNPDRYRKLGGHLPRGVLLFGRPGTGKTLLARAVAGEASVPFFSVSASEFIEAIVGIGASRVRDLFVQAKQSSPAIIFIDELDAIGRARSSVEGSGSNDERDQTLNQILTEMDGFDPHAAVIVIAATNRPETLDLALLRPGRFDRRVGLPSPDAPGRRRILELHTRSLPLSTDVDLGSIASMTPGLAGADLANLCNEAALHAARHGHDCVDMSDFVETIDKLTFGTRRSVVLTADERQRTAYHEAGHAIVAMMTPTADPVRSISIIPRGNALGSTLVTAEGERIVHTKSYLLAKISVLLGGRAAEELVLGDVTSSAESDIREVTELARRMVGCWGMSSAIGPVAALKTTDAGVVPLNSSEASQRLVDEAVRSIVEEAMCSVSDLLRSNRQHLDALAAALSEAETLDETSAYRAVGIERPAYSHADPGLEISPDTLR